jgi:hypothetical protein
MKKIYKGIELPLKYFKYVLQRKVKVGKTIMILLKKISEIFIGPSQDYCQSNSGTLHESIFF